MKIVHLTASTFFGGPEQQMLGLAKALEAPMETHFLSFPEGGRARAFLTAVRKAGFPGQSLTHDTPRLGAAIREITTLLEHLKADVLLCHGYKANLLGRAAARRRHIPAVAVSRGWTGESLRVRCYEALDRFHLRWMDEIVCVSEAQAERVRRTGVRTDLVHVIPNAVDTDRFTDPDPRYRAKLQRYFRKPLTTIVGAAGRLSPEKGFDVLIDAAERVLRTEKSVGFVIFGDGPCRTKLLQQIHKLGLVGSVVLAGYRPDLDRFLPHFDLLTLPSHTEGLPNVILEAFAAAVPVVATRVGGVPEVVEDEISGYLVPANDPEALGERICDAISSEEQLRDMGLNGRYRIMEQFGFATQARRYTDLVKHLVARSSPQAPKSEESPTALKPARVVRISSFRKSGGPRPIAAIEQHLIKDKESPAPQTPPTEAESAPDALAGMIPA